MRHALVISLVALTVVLTGCAGSNAAACPPLTLKGVDRPLVSGDSTSVPDLLGSDGEWPAGGCVYRNSNNDGSDTVNVVYYSAGPSVIDEISAWAQSQSAEEGSTENTHSWRLPDLGITVRALSLDEETAPEFSLGAGDVLAFALVPEK